MTAPDPIFGHPRLAEIYDALDDDRSDLDAYVALVGGLGARSVLDIGCGTGTFACLLAARGLDVTGRRPGCRVPRRGAAQARCRPVRWLTGAATTLPPLEVDLVTMTANVAQVFLHDDEWVATLRTAREALRPGVTSSSRCATRSEPHGASGTEPSRTVGSPSRAGVRRELGLDRTRRG